jgi:hypothetical protein
VLRACICANENYENNGQVLPQRRRARDVRATDGHGRTRTGREASKFKIQAPEKFQISNSNLQGCRAGAEHLTFKRCDHRASFMGRGNDGDGVESVPTGKSVQVVDVPHPDECGARNLECEYSNSEWRVRPRILRLSFRGASITLDEPEYQPCAH